MSMCEKCGARYAPTLQDDGLCEDCERAASGLAALQGEGPPFRDFFISYYTAQQSHATQIDRIVRGMGKTTWFLGRNPESGSIPPEMQHALQRSHRIICVLSAGYFASPACGDELQTMWNAFLEDDDHRIVFFEVGPCNVPMLYQGIRRTNLMGTTLEEYEGKVQEAIESTERQFIALGEGEEAHEENCQPEVAKPLFPHRRWLAAAAVLLLSVSYYLTYFEFGPGDLWDAREAATYAATGRDISLPWNWAIAPANLREYVRADESQALDYWRGAANQPAPLERAGQFLRPAGVSLLKSTMEDVGTIEGGIAQFRAVFQGQQISLVADARADGRAYRGFRLENDINGKLTATYFEKQASGAETVLKTYPSKQLAANVSMHDIGLSKKNGFYTLWHNRAVLATWPPGDQSSRPAPWKTKSGAFGLAVNRSSLVRLFRWSLAAYVSPDTVAVAKLRPQRPYLVSYFAMPGNRRLREDEESWPQ